METNIVITGSAILAVLAFFLRDFFLNIKELKRKSEELEIRVNLSENNHKHTDEKFDKLYIAVDNLTKEIRSLNINIQKKN